MFCCKDCPKVYKHYGSLRNYVKSTHEENKCICETCGTVFRRNAYLTKHQATTHYHQAKTTTTNLEPKHSVLWNLISLKVKADKLDTLIQWLNNKDVADFYLDPTCNSTAVGLNVLS
jgi:uncharacterized C2H2 Zn-finger protein